VNLNWMAKLAWERRHPQLFAGLRFAGGVFLLAPRDYRADRALGIRAQRPTEANVWIGLRASSRW
jgi:hypothetical protein